MKAKIKPLIILIAVFALSLAAGIAAGCSIGEKSAKQMADELGLVCPVTYYANGGQFLDGSSKDQKVYRTIYYAPGSPVFNIGVDKVNEGSDIGITRDGYVFDGWEYCKLNDDGTPILKDDGGNVLTVLPNGTADIKDTNGKQLLEQSKRFTAEPDGRKAFANGRVIINEGEYLYLAATWVQDVIIEYRLVTDTPITTTVTEDGAEKQVTYNTGDLLSTQSFENFQDMVISPSSWTVDLGSTHSYIHMYYDEDCTDPVKPNGTIAKPTDNTNAVIYVKYLQGSWTTVRTDANFATMLSSTTGNFYIPHDIDCSSYNYFSLKRSTSTFNCRVEGNGFTVSGITIPNQRIQSGGSVSLFGKIGKNAQINNLTIESIDVTATLTTGVATVYAMFSEVEEGATFNEFFVQNYSLSISGFANGTILNIQKDLTGNYITDNWLYGMTNDAEFVSKYGNIVQNATLKIDNEQVIGGQQ